MDGRPGSHTTNRLRLLLQCVAGTDDSYAPPEAQQVSFDLRDCRLELIRERGSKLTDEQLHYLEQLDHRLDCVVKGTLVWGPVPELARRTLAAFGWAEGDSGV